jgi:uncharacterized protein YjbJ (UPF0337 family)
MNNDILKGQWTQFKGKVRERWAELSANDVDEINGNFEQLVGKVQQRYGMAKEQAMREVNSWLETANRNTDRK